MRLGIIFSETDCRAVLLRYDNHQARCLETIRIDKKHAETNWKKTALLTIKTQCSKHTRVILGIENQRIITRELSIDVTLTDEQIIAFLKTQAAHLFGATAETLCIDYSATAQSEKKKTICAVAAHFSEIQTWEQLFLEIAFPLDVIDVDTFALFRFENYVAQHTLVNQTPLSDTALKEFSTAIGLALRGQSHEH